MSDKQIRKPIVDASDQEIRDFAEIVLQITDIPERFTRADLLGKLGPVWPADYIYVDAAELPEAQDVQGEEVRAQARQKIAAGPADKDPKWLIKIASTELPGGKDPVAVGVNGRVVVIQRGMEVEVPHRYIGALRDAVRVSVSQDMKTQELSYATFTNYPLEVLERPSRAAIAAFEEETRDKVLTG